MIATLVLYLGEENIGMLELPKTEQELNDLIDAKVTEATDKLTAQHNGAMANLRKKYDEDIKKAKEQANLTAEELAQERIREENEAKDKELNELRAYKKQTVLADKLAKEGLPSYFKNDSRLLSAEEGDLDKAIKEVKKEYEQTLPKGATHSTVVQTATTGQQAKGDDKESVAFAALGQALEQALGK